MSCAEDLTGLKHSTEDAGQCFALEGQRAKGKGQSKVKAERLKFKVITLSFFLDSLYFLCSLTFASLLFQRVALAVGEHSIRAEAVLVRGGGVYGRENVGMSSRKFGENPNHRKPKVSWAMTVIPGLADPKVRPRGVADGRAG